MEVLARYQVDYVLVGGLCAVLHGAPIVTMDMDIVHPRGPENLARLSEALRGIGAHYRHQFGRRTEPGISHLDTPGHQLLQTDIGPLDVLGTIGNGLDYDALLPLSRAEDIEGMSIRLLDLEKLIEVKSAANRDKDRAVLPILRQTLAERDRKS